MFLLDLAPGAQLIEHLTSQKVLGSNPSWSRFIFSWICVSLFIPIHINLVIQIINNNYYINDFHTYHLQSIPNIMPQMDQWPKETMSKNRYHNVIPSEFNIWFNEIIHVSLTSQMLVWNHKWHDYVYIVISSLHISFLSLLVHEVLMIVWLL